MTTTKNLRKNETRKLPFAADGLSNNELAAVTGGGSLIIICDDHKVKGTRPT